MSATESLIALRHRRGLSLGDAAEAITAACEVRVTKSTLGRTERGETEPRPKVKKAIADFYGFEVTDRWPVEVPEEAAA